MKEMRTAKDAMEHLERVAAEDPYNGGSIAYTATDLADVAYIFLDDGHWGNLQPLSERDARALTIMRDWRREEEKKARAAIEKEEKDEKRKRLEKNEK